MIAIIQTTIITLFTSFTLLVITSQLKSIMEIKWRIAAEVDKQELLARSEIHTCQR